MRRRLLCYGDSNTYGYDSRSYLGGRYPEPVRWTGLLKEYGWEVCNEEENGRSTPRYGGEIESQSRRCAARGRMFWPSCWGAAICSKSHAHLPRNVRDAWSVSGPRCFPSERTIKALAPTVFSYDTGWLHRKPARVFIRSPPPQVAGIAFAKQLQNGYNPFVPANPTRIRRYIP